MNGGKKNANLERSLVSTIILPKSAQGIVHVVTGKLGQTSKGNTMMSRLELTIKDKKYMEKKSPFVADIGCNRQIWISFNDYDICDPK